MGTTAWPSTSVGSPEGRKSVGCPYQFSEVSPSRRRARCRALPTSEIDETIDRIRRERAAAGEAVQQADKSAKGWKRPGVRDMNVKAFADSFEQSEGRKR